MKKHGLEVEAEFRNTTANGVYYFVKGMMGVNENRIIFKDDPPYAPEYQKIAGKPLGGQTSGVQLAGNGYFTSVDDIHILPSPLAISGLNVGDYAFIDYNADGSVSNLDAYPIRGSLYPPVTYSFSSGFSYNNFDFSFLFQGNIGKYVEYNQQCQPLHTAFPRYGIHTEPGLVAGSRSNGLQYVYRGSFLEKSGLPETERGLCRLLLCPQMANTTGRIPGQSVYDSEQPAYFYEPY